jgi:hypothetical protein
MSLLMEALKQQQTGPTAPNAAPGLSVNDNGLNVQGIGQGSGQGWKVLALAGKCWRWYCW